MKLLIKLISYRQITVITCLLFGNTIASGQWGNYFAGPGVGSGGAYNTFVGNLSGTSNKTTTYNSFFGYESGFKNLNGSFNTFLGSLSGSENTGGSYNTFAGYLSGQENTNGTFNTYFGFTTAVRNTTGKNNSFFGAAAGYFNTASNNSFFGRDAGYNNRSGTGNTFVGFKSGINNTVGGLNTFIGSVAGESNEEGDNNTFIGFATGGLNTSGRRNSGVGTYAGYRTTTGSENSFFGRLAGDKNTTGSGNTAIGHLAGPSTGNLVNSSAIGNKAYVTTSNSLVLGSVTGVNGAASTIKVGIGTNAAAYLLHVNGVAAKPGGGSWAVASDKRLKRNIRPYTEGLSQIRTIAPVWYEYNGKAGLPVDKQYVGVIAQDMQKIAPYTIGEFSYQDSTGKEERYLDYDANALTYMLVNAVKEQALMIDQLQSKVAQLERQLVTKGPIGDDAANARLLQNYPNPSNTSTVIGFYIPSEVTSAAIKIVNISGQEVYKVELLQRGEGEIEISNQTLSAGTYIYHLVVNGNTVDNRKMIVAR
jgi:trimeric autotransporter adhesin